MGKTQVAPHVYRLSFPDYVDYLVDEANRLIQVQIGPGTEAATWRHLLLDQVLPITMGEAGDLVLHGAANLFGHQAIAFVAPSGGGKSTLATSLSSLGYPMISDDFLRLEFAEQILVWPSYPGSRLGQDSRDFLQLQTHSQLKVAEYTQKFRITKAFPGWPSRAFPLRALMFLRQGETPMLEKIRPGRAVAELTRSAFRLDFSDKIKVQQFWSQIGRVVREVPLFNLIYPRDYQGLSDVHQTIMHHTQMKTNLAQSDL